MPPEAVPINASIASTGKGIRYIGQHCYAFPGEVVETSAVQTMLEFTTGAGYIVGELFLSGAVAPGASGSGAVSTFSLDFNDVGVLLFKVDTSQEDMPCDTKTPILIPPFTNVKLTVVSLSDDAGRFTTAILTGRVYGAE